MPLSETEPIFFETDDAFDRWLDAHPDAQDIWVGFFKKKHGSAKLDLAGLG